MTRADLEARVADAVTAFNALSTNEQAAMYEAQRQSWMRAMAPCEHGDPDWETCPECRAHAKEASDAE